MVYVELMLQTNDKYFSPLSFLLVKTKTFEFVGNKDLELDFYKKYCIKHA